MTDLTDDEIRELYLKYIEKISEGHDKITANAFSNPSKEQKLELDKYGPTFVIEQNRH